MSGAQRFVVSMLELFERDVTLRLPFRFGGATLRAAPQAFVRATIRGADGREASGWTAELMVPKWFDKAPGVSPEGNIADLRRALDLARDAYTSDRSPRTAFGHAAFHYRALLADGAARGLNPLVVSFGAALADRAILDALCRKAEVPFAVAVRANLPALDASLAPDLGRFDLDAFLAALTPASTLAARHTVGLVDALEGSRVKMRPDDDLPVALDEVISRYGHRHFKLKLSGDPAGDVERLTRIAAVLETLPTYAVTLDGNEQFADVAGIAELWRSMRATPALARLVASVLYLEQPLPRDLSMAVDVAALARDVPLLIDEADDTFDAFPRALLCGYTGVSSKNCKGPYKSFVNAARCVAAPPGTRWFVSAEDLTAQCGLAVQQDLALAGLLGVTHVERNGHHYVDGFAGQHAPRGEQAEFVASHRDLYDTGPSGARLAIRNGAIALGSLDAVGFAAAARPDIASLAPLRLDALSPYHAHS
jgi:hypothetical protein